MINSPIYMLYLWTFVSIGRPQDVFPALKALHPGDIVAGLSIITYLLFGDKKRPVFSTPEFKLFLLFLLIAIISTPFGYYPRMSVQFLYDFFVKFGIYLFLVAKLVTTEERIDGMVKTIMLSGLFMAVATIVLSQPGVRAAVGTTYDPNDMALLMVTILPIALTQGLASKRWLWKIFCFGGAVFSLIAIIATQSRGGFLGLIAVAIFILFTRMPGLPKGKLILFSLILAVFFIMRTDIDYKSRMNTIFEDVSSVQAGSGRIMVWKRCLVLAADHPLLGVGPHCFNSAYGYYLENDKFKGDLSPEDVKWAPMKWATAHNSFLLILVEMGIPGLIIFMAFILRFFRNLKQAKTIVTKNNISQEINFQATGLQIAFVGFLVCAFFLSQTYSCITYLFCVLSGAMVSIAYGEFQVE